MGDLKKYIFHQTTFPPKKETKVSILLKKSSISPKLKDLNFQIKIPFWCPAQGMKTHIKAYFDGISE